MAKPEEFNKTTGAEPANGAAPSAKHRGSPWRRAVLTAVATALVGSGGFFVGQSTGRAGTAPVASTDDAVARFGNFHSLPDLIVNLHPSSEVKLMKLGLVLRVPPERMPELAALDPVLVDGLADYLRLLDQEDLGGQEELLLLRRELLRRTRLLAGDIPVQDVLIRTLILQ